MRNKIEAFYNVSNSDDNIVCTEYTWLTDDIIRGALTYNTITLLEKMYPQVIPDINWDDKQLGVYIGQQTLIQQLKRLQQEVDGNV